MLSVTAETNCEAAWWPTATVISPGAVSLGRPAVDRRMMVNCTSAELLEPSVQVTVSNGDVSEESIQVCLKSAFGVMPT